VFRVGTSVAAADAPLISDNDNPATPNTGATLLLRLRFEACLSCNMIESPIKFTNPHLAGSCIALMYVIRVELFIAKTLAMLERDILQSGRFAQLQQRLAEDRRVSGRRWELPPASSGHVWTAPWQELSDVCAALVGCGHVSGLLMRRGWPLALMLCADRVPIVYPHSEVR